MAGQGTVVAPGEDKSAFSFSCQQCKIKKVTTIVYTVGQADHSANTTVTRSDQSNQSPSVTTSHYTRYLATEQRRRSNARGPFRALAAPSLVWIAVRRPANGAPCMRCPREAEMLQGRGRSRPPVSGKNSNPEQLRVKKLNDTMQSCIRFIQNMPNVLSETRIADFVKLNVRRRLGRYSFLSACLRSLDGAPDSASWCKDWFGTDTPLHFLVGAGGALPPGCIDQLRRKIYEDRVPWQPLLSVLGVTSLSEFVVVAEPRSKFLVPLETDRMQLVA